jgi:4-cresol dehydrogenase (hydroxylating)
MESRPTIPLCSNGPRRITYTASQAAAENGTFAVNHRIPAIVRPANREEVQQCLRIANCRHAPVYPVSFGARQN